MSKSPLFETRPGVCRVQVYLPTSIAQSLSDVANLQKKSISRVAAELLEEAMSQYQTGERVVPAPSPSRRQGRLA